MNKIRVLFYASCLVLCGNQAFATGNVILTKGSDTLLVVAQAWAEAYDRVNPKITVSVGGGGSGNGFAALLKGLVDIANFSRSIDTFELERSARLGISPVEHTVGYDALAVYIHKDNPLSSITFKQLEAIFGKGAELKYWTDLGIEVPGCKDQRIVRVGRQNTSGTYAYFRNAILTKSRRFDVGILDMLGSKDVVHLVEKTPCAIGYGGLAYATSKVKMACISVDEKSSCTNPSVASASDGSYPIARPLFMYVNSPARAEVTNYIDWVLSQEGQCILLRKGYAPVRAVKCERGFNFEVQRLTKSWY
jgi:phosphate transport system substrate-binding protein